MNEKKLSIHYVGELQPSRLFHVFQSQLLSYPPLVHGTLKHGRASRVAILLYYNNQRVVRPGNFCRHGKGEWVVVHQVNFKMFQLIVEKDLNIEQNFHWKFI